MLRGVIRANSLLTALRAQPSPSLSLLGTTFERNPLLIGIGEYATHAAFQPAFAAATAPSRLLALAHRRGAPGPLFQCAWLHSSFIAAHDPLISNAVRGKKPAAATTTEAPGSTETTPPPTQPSSQTQPDFSSLQSSTTTTTSSPASTDANATASTIDTTPQPPTERPVFPDVPPPSTEEMVEKLPPNMKAMAMVIGAFIAISFTALLAYIGNQIFLNMKMIRETVTNVDELNEQYYKAENPSMQQVAAHIAAVRPVIHEHIERMDKMR